MKNNNWTPEELKVALETDTKINFPVCPLTVDIGKNGTDYGGSTQNALY